MLESAIGAPLFTAVENYVLDFSWPGDHTNSAGAQSSRPLGRQALRSHVCTRHREFCLLRGFGFQKKANPRINNAIPGLYFYDATVVEVVKAIKPSARGELEITAVSDHYLRAGTLSVTVLERGTAWLDTGTFRSLQDAGEFVRVIEDRQGTKIGCIEEVAWRNGWIDDAQLLVHAEALAKSRYGGCLHGLIR